MAWGRFHINLTVNISVEVHYWYVELTEIKVEPGGDREKGPERLKTHDWGIEVCFVIINPRNLGEASRYEARLMLNERTVLELPVKDPSRGDDVRVGRTWYCLEDV